MNQIKSKCVNNKVAKKRFKDFILFTYSFKLYHSIATKKAPPSFVCWWHFRADLLNTSWKTLSERAELLHVRSDSTLKLWPFARTSVSKSAGLVAQPSLSLSTHSPLGGRKVLQNAILALKRWCEGVIVLGGTLPSSHLIKLGFMLDRNWVKKERRCLYHVLCEGVGLYLWPGKGRHKPFWM